MKMMQVRAAAQGDAAAIARLQVSVWRAAYRGQIEDAYLAGLNVDSRTKVWADALQDPKQVVLDARRTLVSMRTWTKPVESDVLVQRICMAMRA